MKNFTVILCLIAAGARAQPMPLLNSYPQAKATIFLDFRGGTVAGTIWNAGRPVLVTAPPLSNADIEAIHRDVAKRFELFNLNITTDSSVYAKAPVTQRSRVIFATDGSWYGSVGGTACIGSFRWGNETPAWVFTDNLSNDPQYIAASATHQIGHVLGLGHQSIYDNQGNLLSELNGGEPAFPGYAPLMGVPYYRKADWYDGLTSLGNGKRQIDTAVIAGPANGFGYRKSVLPYNAAMASVTVASPFRETIHVTSDDAYRYRLFTSAGQLLGQGSLVAGTNDIAATQASSGMLLLEWYNGSRRGTEKIIKQ